jgi:cyclopropane-fatty-acyl-phospholipid synthase
VGGPLNSWLEKYIFPGAYIPTLAEILGLLTARSFRVWDVENLGPYYRRTLDHWSERFERAVPTIRAMYDEAFVRMWRLYLRGASANFGEGTLEVHQILVSNGSPEFPLLLTRADLYRGPGVPSFDASRNPSALGHGIGFLKRRR